MHRLAAVFILVVALHSPVWAQSDFHIISQVADGVFPDGTSYKTTFIIIPWFDAASPTCNIRFYGIQVHLGSETANSFTVNSTGWWKLLHSTDHRRPGTRYRIRNRRV